MAGAHTDTVPPTATLQVADKSELDCAACHARARALRQVPPLSLNHPLKVADKSELDYAAGGEEDEQEQQEGKAEGQQPQEQQQDTKQEQKAAAEGQEEGEGEEEGEEGPEYEDRCVHVVCRGARERLGTAAVG